ncbi:MAG: hypothetical protein QF661_10810 [Arenicellales bacterium]|nr:hypothetical protein [Arenicellales bacterium]
MPRQARGKAKQHSPCECLPGRVDVVAYAEEEYGCHYFEYDNGTIMTDLKQLETGRSHAFVCEGLT